MVERPNPDYDPPYNILQIVLFFFVIVGFICGSFDHADVKYRKWMPVSKSLLMIILLQVFGSPIYKILFTVFQMDVARGFNLASQGMMIIIEVLHFYLWMDSFFYEKVAFHSSSQQEPQLKF